MLSYWVMSDFAMLWTVARQVPMSRGSSRQQYWRGLPCPHIGDLHNPGIEPRSPTSQCILSHLSHEGSPRILEWVAYPFSRWSSWPRNWTRVSCIAGRFCTSWATREARTYESLICTTEVDRIPDGIWKQIQLTVWGCISSGQGVIPSV